MTDTHNHGQDNQPAQPVDRFERERRAVAREARVVFVMVLVLAVLIYLFSGLTAIGQDEVGLHYRFGELTGEQDPGLHLNWPWPIDEVVRLPNRNNARKLAVNTFNLHATELNAIANTLAVKYKTLPRNFWSAAFDPYLITGEPEDRGLSREIARALAPAEGETAAPARADITTRNVLHMGVDLNYRIIDPVAFSMQTAGEPERLMDDLVTSELIHYAAHSEIDTLLSRDLVRVRADLRDACQGTLVTANASLVDLVILVLPDEPTDEQVRRVFFPEQFDPRDIPEGLRGEQRGKMPLTTLLQLLAISKPLQAELRELANTQAARVLVARKSLAAWWQELLARRQGHFLVFGGMGVQVDPSGGIAINDTRVPEYVAPSFEKVTTARAEQGRILSDASRAAEQIVSNAKIAANDMLEGARAYRDRVKAIATKEAEGFELLRAEYEKSPRDFRRRKSLEAMQELAAKLGGRIFTFSRDASGRKIILRLDQAGGGGLDMPALP
jgi:regulator of protease activity HflC (stomatin/prohibitin superfamily)